MLDRLDRDLELAQHAVAVRQRDVLGAQVEIRAGRDDDLVLAGGVDGDQRDASRAVRALQLVEADTGFLELGERGPREVILADAGDQRHDGAEPGRGDRLVGALPARDLAEGRAGDGLPRPRQPLGTGDEIEVDGADDGETGRLHARETIPP